MNADMLKNVGIIRDEKGKLLHIVEIKVVDKETLNSLRQELAVADKEREEEKQKLVVEKAKAEYRNNIVKIVVAKQQYNELVECGKIKGNQEFEDMYDDFINGKKFDEEKAPYDFMKILGRLDK